MAAQLGTSDRRAATTAKAAAARPNGAKGGRRPKKKALDGSARPHKAGRARAIRDSL